MSGIQSDAASNVRSARQQQGLHVAAASPIAPPSARLPEVFVVGAAKSGTTALYHYFRSHPQVFAPSSIKETNYMAFYKGLPPLAGPGDKQALAGKSITRFADYQALWPSRTTETVAVDVSPAYLCTPEAAGKIAELCPQAKIVVILRNPIECAFSFYSMMRRDGREPCRKFWDAFQQSPKRIATGWEWAWDYQHCPMFADQVARYQKLFPARQLFIRRYEELKRSPTVYYRELCKFLGISPIDLTSANRQVNLSPTYRDMIRNYTAGRWMMRIVRAAGFALPRSVKATIAQRTILRPAFVLSDEDRRRLIVHFEADIRRLAKQLSWDLSDWLR